MKKETAIAAGIAGAAVVGLAAIAMAKAPVPPPALLGEYLRLIAAAITKEELEKVRSRFEADFSAQKLPREDYAKLYDAYIERSKQLYAMTALDIRAIKPDELMPAPDVYVDKVFVGRAPVLWSVKAGTYTVSWEDKPGGDNPAPGVAYYKAPSPQTVTVTEGLTVKVEGKYTIVPLTPADAVFVSFYWEGYGPNPTLPPGNQIAVIGLRNPTDRPIDYRVYVYSKKPELPDPTPQDPIVGSIGYSDCISFPPGSFTFLGLVKIPDTPGTFPVWLRIYDNTGGWLRFLKAIDTGTAYTVAAAPPPPPPPMGWVVETQLQSIMPYLVSAWVLRAGVWLVYSPGQPDINTLREIYVGENVWLKVTQNCQLTYGGKIWSLKAGDNFVIW